MSYDKKQLLSYEKKSYDEQNHMMKVHNKMWPIFSYHKSVLRKVSFDAVLFKKELEKGLIALSEREGVRLYRWALTFTRSQPDLNCNIQFAF